MISRVIGGRVVKGQGLGKQLGFPTANLDRKQYSRQRLALKLGVYAGLVTLAGGKKYKAGIVIGPKDKTGLPKLEAHLINYKGNLYGKKISIELKKFLRPFTHYQTEVLLKKQIAKDITTIKKLNLHE